MTDAEMAKEALCYLRAKTEKKAAVDKMSASEKFLRRGLKERGATVLQFGELVVGVSKNGNRLSVTPVAEMNSKPMRKDEVPF